MSTEYPTNNQIDDGAINALNKRPRTAIFPMHGFRRGELVIASGGMPNSWQPKNNLGSMEGADYFLLSPPLVYDSHSEAKIPLIENKDFASSVPPPKSLSDLLDPRIFICGRQTGKYLSDEDYRKMLDGVLAAGPAFSTASNVGKSIVIDSYPYERIGKHTLKFPDDGELEKLIHYNYPDAVQEEPETVPHYRQFTEKGAGRKRKKHLKQEKKPVSKLLSSLVKKVAVAPTYENDFFPDFFD